MTIKKNTGPVKKRNLTNGRKAKKDKEIIETKTLKEKKELVELIEKHLPGLQGEAELEEVEMTKKKMGRPVAITDAHVQKVKLCFSVGMNLKESLYFSQVKKSSFYNYLKEHPDLLEEIEHLKNSISMQAKINIGKSIKDGNVGDSWKWLGVKDKAFIPKIGVGGTDGEPLNISFYLPSNGRENSN